MVASYFFISVLILFLLVGPACKESEMVEINADQEINIKGEVCPYTFIRAKLALEEMEPGQVLRVIVDHPPAVENVPRSMTNEGHKVLEVKKLNQTDWAITIRKVE